MRVFFLSCSQILIIFSNCSLRVQALEDSVFPSEIMRLLKRQHFEFCLFKCDLPS